MERGPLSWYVTAVPDLRVVMVGHRQPQKGWVGGVDTHKDEDPLG